jgi:protein-tyrosine-phosphatase/predicted ATP-grasp superfamily ATP-dependent carboligase
MTTNAKCALILDGQSRAAVETLQALGRHGVQVDIAAEQECVAFHSRYPRQRLNQPPTHAPHLLAEWLVRQDALWNYCLIVASTEFSLQAFRTMPDESPLRRKAVLPGNESLDIALNKKKTCELATQLGITVPRSVLIESSSKLPPVERYPIVLKPIESTRTAPDSMTTLAPVIAKSESDRMTTLENWLPFVSVQQQEYILGHGMGIEFLFHHGRRLWHFAHERIHEYPLTGGGSTYRRSVYADAKLLKQSESLLATLQWNGVAMVEFKMGRDGTFYLMEINPRLWGSLALSIDAGVNFPLGLWGIANNETLPEQPKYKTDYYARDLANDLQWQIENWRANHRDALLLTKPRARSFAEYLRPLLGKESWDHCDVGDPKVTAAILTTIGRRYFNSVRSNIRRKRAESKSVSMHRRAMHSLSRRSSPVRSLLFLCYGNICRSLLAERLARQVLTNLQVESAGLHAQEGQRSPENMVCAANRIGIDLKDSGSRCLTREQVNRADLIFVMDAKNQSDLIRRFPEAADRTLLLGLFLDRPAVNIEDPYRASEEQTWEVVTQIRSAVNALARQLHKAFANELRA